MLNRLVDLLGGGLRCWSVAVEPITAEAVACVCDSRFDTLDSAESVVLKKDWFVVTLVVICVLASSRLCRLMICMAATGF